MCSEWKYFVALLRLRNVIRVGCLYIAAYAFLGVPKLTPPNTKLSVFRLYLIRCLLFYLCIMLVYSFFCILFSSCSQGVTFNDLCQQPLALINAVWFHICFISLHTNKNCQLVVIHERFSASMLTFNFLVKVWYQPHQRKNLDKILEQYTSKSACYKFANYIRTATIYHYSEVHRL